MTKKDQATCGHYMPALSEVRQGEMPHNNFFKCPNLIARIPGLSASAKVVWMYLASVGNDWMVSMGKIGEEVGMSRNTVRRAIRELEDIGLLESTPKKSGGKVIAYRYVVNYATD